MSIKVKEKDWNNQPFRDTILAVAELMQEDIEIEFHKVKFKPYNVQIWINDSDVEEKDFSTKKQALKWIKQRLSLKKYREIAYADLKKYNKSNDELDWWYYKFINNSLVEVDTVGE